MRRLLATTCLTSLIVAAPLAAETVIDAKRTTGVSTATIKNGAADDIKIVAAGSVVPTSGVAVTLNSANKVLNEGTIQITDANDAVGIQAIAGATGAITNSGKIIVDETYAPADGDKDGDLDGPHAQGARRFGIRTLGGFTGNIANSGTITVEGNDSGGIALGGPLTGSFANTGTVTVVGDRSVAIRTGDVSGPVRLAGTIAATGKDAVAVSLEGDIAGALVVQGAIGSTGYRATAAPADPSKLDADDLLQGGPALRIAGNVAGGVILAVPPKDSSATDTDEDKDGIEDAKEGSAAITSYGSAAAVQIGSATRAVTLADVVATAGGHGLVIDGGVAGVGVHAGIEANGITVGGLGGAVTITGGIAVNGAVEARSNGASATAIRIGSGANVAAIDVAGAVTASGGSSAASKTGAIVIDAGATVGTIRNKGAIKATASGAAATASAILDNSGGVTLVENSGAISATGAAAGSGRNAAIDLRANTSGATVRQTLVASGLAAPTITGDIFFGSGADMLDIADGQVTGTTRFGAGANRLTMSGDAVYTGDAIFGAGNDVMSLKDTATFTGAADFGGGADSLSLAGGARFRGTLANSQGLAVSVTGGSFEVTSKGAVSLASLSVGAKGVIGVTVDSAGGGNTLYQVSGNADFAAGSKVAVRLTNVTNAAGRYTIVRAGSVTGAANLTTGATVLPYLFKGSVVAGGPANEIAIDIARKSATELGLNGSQASAYDAVYKALGKDAKVAGAFLDIVEGDSFRSSLRQMLPDHAGGTFEAVTHGSRTTAALLSDPTGPFSDQGKWGYWIQQVGWGTSKSLGDTASYDITGWGISGGTEMKTGAGNFGVSLAYLHGKDADGGTDNEVSADQYELAAYWRGAWGGLRGFARASAAHIGFDGTRRFEGMAGTEAVERTADADWNGRLFSGAAGVSYEMKLGKFRLRPIAAIDYYRLREDGYAETGGGKAFDLIVASRTSDELALSGTVAAGLDFGGTSADDSWFRTEIEAGRRQLVGGSLGKTVARFDGGEAFTLEPEERTNGWVGKLRAVGGNDAFRLGGEVSAEEQQGRAAIGLRASLQIGL